MATLAGSIAYPGISADRMARTILATVSGTVASGTSSECSLITVPRTPTLTTALTLDVCMSQGSYTAGTITIQLSNDGTNWYNSGAAAINFATTPASVGTAAAQSISLNISGHGLPARYVRANIATQISGTGSPIATIGLTVQ